MSSLHQRAKDVFLAALERPRRRTRRLSGGGLRRRRGPAAGGRVAAGVSRRRRRRSRAGTGRRSRAAFAPGEVFAGRYRMIARIGRGGMGDVWRADDLVLQTAGRAEADPFDGPGRPRAHPQRSPARAADHAPGRVPRLRRRRGRRRHLLLDGAGRGRGPGRAAPARRPAAVGEGGRHRPSAVRRPGGRARARRAASRSQAGERAHRRRRAGADHRFRHRDPEDRRRPSHADRHAGLHGAGTAARRARRCRSGPTSTRWAWCCTSCSSDSHAFDRSERPTSRRRPSTLVPNVDPQLERVVMQALSPDPRDRPASALEMAASLPDIGVRRDTGRCDRRRSEPAGDAVVGRRGRAGGGRRSSLVVASSFFVSPGAPHADRAGHDRPGRLREHDRRAGVRRRAEGGAGRGARAVAVPEGVSRRPRAGNAAADAALARRARHAIASRARSRGANS